MSATLNQRKAGTLMNNIMQNPKNDNNVLSITTKSGITTIDPPLPVANANVDETFIMEPEKSIGGDDAVAKESVHMTPKAAKKKKVDTFGTQAKFPKPSGSMTEYPRQRRKDSVFRIPSPRRGPRIYLRMLIGEVISSIVPEEVIAIYVQQSDVPQSEEAIPWHDIYDRAFKELTNLLFLYMIQKLCDEVDVPEILRVNERVHAMATTQIKNPSDAHVGDVGIGVDMEIKEQREAPNSKLVWLVLPRLKNSQLGMDH
ncbi:hypothetical protein FXO38_20618 [Capsicum annuum]|nr:hypothetical protein FXO38_20618 [Capsicum annuum]